VTGDFTIVVFAIFVFGPVAVLATGVRQNHRIVIRLLKAATVA